MTEAVESSVLGINLGESGKFSRKFPYSLYSVFFLLESQGGGKFSASFLIFSIVLPRFSLCFFQKKSDICKHIIISCKNNDSVSCERKKRIPLKGSFKKKEKKSQLFSSRFEFKQLC